MNSEQLKTHYSALRTKLASMRTLLLFVVSIKAFILLSVTKHINIGVYAALGLLVLCGYHYYYIITEINKGNYIEQSYVLDFYPLLLIPILLVLTYYNLRYKLNIKG
jgi:hypothetical protein